MQPGFVYSVLVLGVSSLRLTILEPKENIQIRLYTLDKGFEMNDAMANFLNAHPDLQVAVQTN